MSSAAYDIEAQQYSTFMFHIEYIGTTGASVNLSSHTARFQVRANADSAYKLLEITTSGLTHGGSTGDFLAGVTGRSGVSGSGNIGMNKSDVGAGLTGGILITADATSMGFVRAGSWQYSLDITAGVTTEELIYGRFIVSPKVTR